ncbi:hypothetical protein C9J21_21200 [Photobacterium phosphoreum]|nr:hypothetical protein C9J21_21200 [Photobacterium phosphoreum]
MKYDEVGNVNFDVDSVQLINLVCFLYERKDLKRSRSIVLNEVIIKYENNELVRIDYEDYVLFLTKIKNKSERKALENQIL